MDANLSFAKSRKPIMLGIAALGVLALLLLLAAAATQVGRPAPGMRTEQPPAAAETQAAAGYEIFSPMSGNHQGTWTNATFGTRGTLALDLRVNPDGIVSGDLDIGGTVFGLLDPDPMMLSGSYTAATLTMTGSDTTFGVLTVTVGADGAVTIAAPDVPAPGIDRFEASGTIENNELTAHYIVFFEGGTRAEGSLTMR